MFIQKLYCFNKNFDLVSKIVEDILLGSQVFALFRWFVILQSFAFPVPLILSAFYG